MTYRKLDERIRISLWYEYKLGHSGNAAYENLVRVYGPTAIAQRTVWKWYKKFRAGNEDIDRKASAGVSTSIDDNELEDIVKRNPEISRKQLAKQFGVAHSTIYTHLELISKGQKMRYAPRKIVEPTSTSNASSECIPTKACFTGSNNAETSAAPTKPPEPRNTSSPQAETCLVYSQGDDLCGSFEAQMSPTSRDIRRRVCIWYEYKLGNSGTTAKANLDRVFGDAAPSQSSIWRWYRKFREGDETLDVNTERYSLVDDDELETLKKDNPELTLADLAARFGVGSSTIWNHLDRIAKGKKMKSVAKKHEEPVSAVQLIAKPEKKRYYPGTFDLPSVILF
ncbi:hypothetical protein ANCDUO_08729 [Ancylostoma duodenale]|uniref:Mos1 transposase HTH domain-containing protein n=1 Tax=Ancylostoma duodenale TaxID=51022 RepID=A0A0C2CVT2_9BILA|nr:hypothetical protein ANCDUO_08729 [Ancylostoma duodenale]